jgi:hypothetical protein
MNNESPTIAVLVDAKEEYISNVISILKPTILKTIKSMYHTCEEICYNENAPDNILMLFQDKCSKVPSWSVSEIDKKYTECCKQSKCDYLDELIKLLFITQIRILSMAHNMKPNSSINLQCPNGKSFMFLSFIEVARECWKQPYLFNKYNGKIEYQKNIVILESIIDKAITNTFKNKLPIKSLIKDYFDFDNLNINNSSSQEHKPNQEPASKLNTNNELEDTDDDDSFFNIDNLTPRGKEFDSNPQLKSVSSLFSSDSDDENYDSEENLFSQNTEINPSSYSTITTDTADENEDNAPENEDNAPENEDNAPENEDNAPENDDNAPENDDNVPENDDNVPENEDNVSENDDNVPENDDNVPENEDNVPENEDNVSENEEEIAPNTTKKHNIENINNELISNPLNMNVKSIKIPTSNSDLDFNLDELEEFNPVNIETRRKEVFQPKIKKHKAKVFFNDASEF